MAASDPASLRRAITFYEQAVALDSSFVAAWAQLARARSGLYGNGTPEPQLGKAAKAAAEQAQRLGPNRPEGYLALGVYHALVERDMEQAGAAFEAGLKVAPNNIALLANASATEAYLGHWEAALPRLLHAVALDPRAPGPALNLAGTLQNLRRYGPADSAADRAIGLAPTSLSGRRIKAEVALGRGDLPGAQAAVQAGLTAVDPVALLASFAVFDDLYWVLDDAQQRQLLTFAPSAFDDDRGAWGLVRAQTYHLRGSQQLARIYADSARLAFEAQLRGAPQDAQRHALLGLALAYLGHTDEAIKEAERGAELAPVSRDASLGPYIQHLLARIYLLAGQHERALDHLEPLLRIPYVLSPGWLRIDPTFAPLKANPRFERLIAGS
jgi:tetratricopeptide (TPR) repeat protein